MFSGRKQGAGVRLLNTDKTLYHHSGMKVSGVNTHDQARMPDHEEIREELNRVMGSPVFRGSRRCQDFLQYVVGTVLEGDAGTLKERTLAIEVFGRHATDDLGTDSIVRVGAREVRKRLAQFYVAEGAQDPVRIELPPGSYIPSFQYHSEISEAAPVPAVALPETETVPRRAAEAAQPVKRSLPWLRIVVVAATAAAVSLLVWKIFAHFADPFEVFWQPAFAQKTPMALLIAHPIVYHPSYRAQRMDEERNGKARLPLQRPIDIPSKLLDGSDYVAVTDQYVGFGDTAATIRLATLFLRKGGNIRVRMASKVEFRDLVGAGAVLVGAFTNRWTTELSKDFRFRLGYDNLKPCILDASNGHKWALADKSDNGRSNEDYLLISRIPHSSIDGFIVVCAGLTGYGTEEAGRILSQPELLDPILQRLPSDWANKNLELILHVQVVGDAPALPTLVAQYTW